MQPPEHRPLLAPDSAPAPAPAAPCVLIVHEVQAYPQWKAIFDAAAGMRAAAGERSYQVLCDTADPALIVHFSTWTSHAAARRFFESPELVEIRRQAGVKAPRFLYLHQLEAGFLQST